MPRLHTSGRKKPQPVTMSTLRLEGFLGEGFLVKPNPALLRAAEGSASTERVILKRAVDPLLPHDKPERRFPDARGRLPIHHWRLSFYKTCFRTHSCCC